MPDFEDGGDDVPEGGEWTTDAQKRDANESENAYD